MATVREHYATHLAPVYLWMSGGFERAIALGRADLEALNIDLSRCRTAVDLGAGFGMHTIPLAQGGCSVTAIDTSALLVHELHNRSAGLLVRIVTADLLDVEAHVPEAVPLVVCMGDTITHLQNLDEVDRLFQAVSRRLAPQGHFILTFRDYTSPAQGTARFIPVRSDADRILTCFLEEQASHMVVHDILHERHEGAWEMRISAYRKLRLAPAMVVERLQAVGLSAVASPGPRGMVSEVATAAGG
jgi:SAM-dependent methyltransferase